MDQATSDALDGLAIIVMAICEEIGFDKVTQHMSGEDLAIIAKFLVKYT